VGDLQVVNKGGIDYYVFSLDINEPNNDPDWFLTLNELKIHTVGRFGRWRSCDRG
jgi:hypothetical protein